MSHACLLGPAHSTRERPSTSSQSVWVGARPLLSPTQTFPRPCFPVAKWMETQLPPPQEQGRGWVMGPHAQPRHLWGNSAPSGPCWHGKGGGGGEEKYRRALPQDAGRNGGQLPTGTHRLPPAGGSGVGFHRWETENQPLLGQQTPPPGTGVWSPASASQGPGGGWKISSCPPWDQNVWGRFSSGAGLE